MDGRKLLYVEDESVIRQNFSELFLNSGYSVFAVDGVQKASSLIDERNDFTAAVFDIELAADRFAGIELCRQFRKQNPFTPIVLLSAHTDVEMQEMAYQLGADAYVAKDEPLSLLLVRLNTLVERFSEGHGRKHLKSSMLEKMNKLSSGLVFDLASEMVTYKEAALTLNSSRFQLLYALCHAGGRILSVYDLQAAIGAVVEPNTIVQNIKLIRGELKRVGADPECLQTVRGRGYRWLSR